MSRLPRLPITHWMSSRRRTASSHQYDPADMGIELGMEATYDPTLSEIATAPEAVEGPRRESAAPTVEWQPGHLAGAR
ncbi:MAG: hypothetical protein E6Q92_08385 [Burkholderiaceae bacterium]|nr:MAG: hypothetical protein E6Q92_08385 [Burkholderiaceae bacterium]